MKLNIYDENLNRSRFIEQNFISCLWKENYNSQGTLSLEMAATTQAKEILKPDYYVGRTDRKTLMVIKSVETTEDTIIATGSTADRQLDDVSYIGTIVENSTVTEAVKTAYAASNGYPCFVIGESELKGKYAAQISNKSVCELLETMCTAVDIGYRAVKDGKTVKIEFYQPEADENLKFSELYGNLQDLSITLSTQNYKNCAYVLGEGEGIDRKRIYVDIRDDDTEQKRELIIEANDIRQEENETLTEYYERLKARGIEKLIETFDIIDVDFTPLPNQFGEAFDLGDIVTVLIPGYNLKLKARITSFQEKEQNNNTQITVEVGKTKTITIGG